MFLNSFSESAFGGGGEGCLREDNHTRGRSLTGNTFSGEKTRETWGSARMREAVRSSSSSLRGSTAIRSSAWSHTSGVLSNQAVSLMLSSRQAILFASIEPPPPLFTPAFSLCHRRHAESSPMLLRTREWKGRFSDGISGTISPPSCSQSFEIKYGCLKCECYFKYKSNYKMTCFRYLLASSFRCEKLFGSHSFSVHSSQIQKRHKQFRHFV